MTIMPFIESLAKIVIVVLLAFPLLVSSFLYFAQNKLIFIQQKKESEFFNWIRTEYPHAEEVRIKTPDNIRLHGWYAKSNPSLSEKSPLLIYFGGNAEEVSKHIREIDYLKGWALLLVNYRGYGLSEGSPSEQNLFNDAILLYDIFSKRADVDKHKMVAFGRSLGTGVAVYLASQRTLSGVILASPYDSIRHISQKLYPYVPISLLLKHHFDSLGYAPTIKIPMLALIAEQDSIVPHQHSLALIEAWGGMTQHKVIPETTHNDISTGYGYWETIMTFLNSIVSENW